MLDDRKTAILRAVVEEYISTAQPVGSSHIANTSGVQVSSATVRNDMSFLEQEGYLAQPHTSAGRIPTDKGYRFFVDHLTPSGTLELAAQDRIGQFFDTAHGRLEETLQRTSTLLAEMTNYAAVVMGPKAEVAVVRSVQLVGLSAHMAMVVVVLSNGVVESEPIELNASITDDQTAAASQALSRIMIGKALGASLPLMTSGDVIADALAAQVVRAMNSRRVDESVFVGGSNVAMATLHNEDQVRLKDVRPGDTVTVRKAGDVIPEVVGPVLSLRPKGSQPWVFPSVCSCPMKGELTRPDGEVNMRCIEPNCPQQRDQRIIYFVSRGAMDIDGFGEQTVIQLSDAGILSDAGDIY